MASEIPDDAPANDDGMDVFDELADLPSLRQRWTVRRKAAVIAGVRAGWLPVEDVCQLYKLSVDELLAWERDIDRNGVPGLRVTRYQIYRDTDARRGQ
jgi:Protein of unknown function (DUF1153)